jgi:hypothetical protein
MPEAKCDHVFLWKDEAGNYLGALKVASTGKASPASMLDFLKAVSRDTLQIEVKTVQPSRFSPIEQSR